MNMWQPIETMPLDETILVYFPDIGVNLVWGERFDEDGFIDYYINDHKHGPYLLRGWNKMPTHWMSLPENPSTV